MRQPFIFFFLLLFFSAKAVVAQGNPTVKIDTGYNQLQNPVENISVEISKISKSIESLNQKMKNFFDTFSSNQGLRLSERQQKLLIAFEILNRAEQRLATLQNLKIDLTEKQTAVKIQLSKIEEQARPEDIDRNIALTGTTNAEELRTMRRQVLTKERTDLTNLSNEIQTTLGSTNAEIRQAESFVKNLRQRLFPELEKEISDL